MIYVARSAKSGQSPPIHSGPYVTVEEAIMAAIGGQVIWNSEEQGYLVMSDWQNLGRITWEK